jgi:hypothetical protein
MLHTVKGITYDQSCSALLFQVLCHYGSVDINVLKCAETVAHYSVWNSMNTGDRKC